MKHEQTKRSITSAIPTIICALAIALSFWVISATEAKAESLRQAMLTVKSNPEAAHSTFWAPDALLCDGAGNHHINHQ